MYNTEIRATVGTRHKTKTNKLKIKQKTKTINNTEFYQKPDMNTGVMVKHLTMATFPILRTPKRHFFRFVNNIVHVFIFDITEQFM